LHWRTEKHKTKSNEYAIPKAPAGIPKITTAIEISKMVVYATPINLTPLAILKQQQQRLTLRSAIGNKGACTF